MLFTINSFDARILRGAIYCFTFNYDRGNYTVSEDRLVGFWLNGNILIKVYGSNKSSDSRKVTFVMKHERGSSPSL